MKPMKNMAATDASITAIRVFFFFCSGVEDMIFNQSRELP